MDHIDENDVNYVNTIRGFLLDTEILAQLAEEAAELAQAALKMRRVLDGTNPTPKTMGEAYENLMEEISDVETCLIVLGYNGQEVDKRKRQVRERKLPRWAGRLRERNEK